MPVTKENESKENNFTVKKLKRNILVVLGLTKDPVVRVYNGYGNNENLTVYGHTFSLSPLPGKKYTTNIIRNALSLIRLFMVRPLAGAHIKLHWDGATYEATSEADGFYRIEWKPLKPLLPGWHALQVNLVSETGTVLSTSQGHVFVPDRNQYTCISDIDDTFLISHSSNLRKRLFVLLTENAHSRMPFESVVDHYQLLASAGTTIDKPNPFFYVSSSEWNLYNYILDFSEKHNMPKGIYLLSQVKQLSQVLKTGQGKHGTKFMRIARIFESYPENQYILLGDDTQEDPNIYAAIVEHFPQRVRCVYLRNVQARNYEKVKSTVEKITSAGVPCCYFKHSSEAIRHSRQIGLAGSNFDIAGNALQA